MKIVAENSTLVLAGSWNPAILTPNWIAKTILKLPPEPHFDVKVEMQVAQGAVQRLSFLGLSYVASPQFLVFFIDPANTEAAAKAVRVARGVLEILSHTPITGVGCNFDFVVEEHKEEFLRRFHAADDLEDEVGEAEVVSKAWGNKIKTSAGLLSIDCVYEGGAGQVHLNFHQETPAAEDARAYLASDEKFVEVFKSAKAIAMKLSNENIGDQA